MAANSIAPGEWDWMRGIDWGDPAVQQRLGSVFTGGASYGNGTFGDFGGGIGGSNTGNNLAGLAPLLGLIPGVGPILGGAAGILGPILQQNKDRKRAEEAQAAANAANEARYKQILGLYQGSRDLAHQQLNTQGQYLKDLTGKNSSVNQYLNQARSEIEGVGNTARRDILDREKKQIAATNQSLTSRGLGNSSILDNARRGVMADTNRSLSGLSESLAGLRSGLAERRAGAQSGLERDLTDFMWRRTGLETDLMHQQAGPIERRVDTFDLSKVLPYLGRSNSGGGSSSGGGLLGGLIGGIASIFG